MDLFGNEIDNRKSLKEKFIIEPFSVVNLMERKLSIRNNKWKLLGIEKEVFRKADLYGLKNRYDGFSEKSIEARNKIENNKEGVSIFSPVLCEILYNWFCPEGGNILDPFAGGSVRGIVANKMGFKYTGIELRQEQVESNREQALSILELNNQPQWYCGDSEKELNGFSERFDFIFSCPPYLDLEVYSDLEDDLSNMELSSFEKKYEKIIQQCFNLLKNKCFTCFVVSEVRDKKHKNKPYLGFVPMTIKLFEKAGFIYYNEIIIINNTHNANLRANKYMNTKKVVRVHQNALVFYKQ